MRTDISTGPPPDTRRRPSFPARRAGAWATIGAWLLIVVAAIAATSGLGSTEDNDPAAWAPTGAGSTRAAEIAGEHFETGDVTPALIVYTRESGVTDADREAAERDRAAVVAGLPGLTTAGPPPGPVVTSPDGAALLLTVGLDAGAEQSMDPLRALAADGAPPGLGTTVTGPAAIDADLEEVFGSLDSTLMIATGLVVAVLLLVTYRSPVLWLVPLLVVGVASVLATSVVDLLAAHAGLPVNGQSAGILTVLVFGAGTDYALLLIARYREELRLRADHHDAMSVALRRSRPALLASAGTVVAALLCLLAADMAATRGLGPVAAIGIACAYAAMTTLLPALLVLVGRPLFWPFVPRAGAAGPTGPLWGRIADFTGRRPRRLWTASAAGLVALTLGTAALSIGVSREEQFTDTPESISGQVALARHFPAGEGDPVEVYMRTGAEEEVVRAVANAPGVAATGTLTRAGGWSYLPVTLEGSADGADAERTVRRIRAMTGDDVFVGGTTAVRIDEESAHARDREVVIPLVLAVVLVVLIVLLRALVAPLVLLASVLLSFFAALGGAALLYEAVGHPGMDPSVLLLGFLFLVALGVDYTIFLLTRAREELPLGHRRAVLRALAVTGGVITSAGLVLAATFSVLIVLPLVLMVQLGILVAVGVALDTLVVRTVLVPALALVLGERFWWPARPASRAPLTSAAVSGQGGPRGTPAREADLPADLPASAAPPAVGPAVQRPSNNHT